MPDQSDPGRELAGNWRRTLLVDEDGTRDTSTDVSWLQAERAFLDLRRPAGRPSFAGVRSLRGLGFGQIRWLATQQAFAGELIDRGDHVEWVRHIDLHPPGRHPDAGTLTEAAGVLVERGRYTDYLEHWRREPPGGGPSWAMSLVERHTETPARLLRVGAVFGWARGRRAELATGPTLAEMVEAAPSLALAQDLVDVEVSLGVADAEWTVTASSLPYREDTAFLLTMPGKPIRGDTVTTEEPGVTGEIVARRWTVTDVEGEVAG
ncbi:MAG TPA: hypothetical protein VGH89_04990 [Pseudonocardia sp.]